MLFVEDNTEHFEVKGYSVFMRYAADPQAQTISRVESLLIAAYEQQQEKGKLIIN